MKRALLLLLAVGVACDAVPIDDQRNDKRLFQPRGVIRGTVSYEGPRPCSRSGHIVGNAIVLVFDRRNPPPPAGIATNPVNFVAVPGDVLFANEPRSVGADLFCPEEPASITASVPFTVAPLDGGSYMIAAFYDRRGRFAPTFEFRNEPESGDIGGGYIDLADFQKNGASASYQPIYLPVNVGIPQQTDVPAGQIADYAIPPSGYVADNVPVTLGSIVPFTRPYFHPVGAEQLPPAAISDANQTGDPLAVPIVAMTQDIHIFAPPASPTPATIQAYEDSFKKIPLAWGVTDAEQSIATDPAQPFDLQLPPLPPSGKGGLLVFAKGGSIPENAAVPALWPQIAFVKLADDPFRTLPAGAPRPPLPIDPQSAVVQGTPQESVVTGQPVRPIVVLTAITLDGNLLKTIGTPPAAAPTTAALRSSVTALIRPAVLCFDPRRVDLGGVLVTPFATGSSSDANEKGEKPLFDQQKLASQPGVREVKLGCLPKGRYAMTMVYPTGQAWTVPNEVGTCASSEGVPTGDDPATCSAKPRPVLLSQGARSVLEIVAAQNPSFCAANPVPEECLHL